MVSELELEFPNFITHVPLSRLKWAKIGFNRLYSSPHFHVRSAFIAAMHKYLESNIPDDLKIDYVLDTELIVYAPINFGGVKRLTDKKTKKGYINWKLPAPEYKPNWDIGNLALIWLKALDDVLIKKGIIKDDNIQFIRKTSYEFRPVDTLAERKLTYKLKRYEQISD